MARSRTRRGEGASRLVLGALLATTAGGCSTVPNAWPVPTSLARLEDRPSLLRVEQMIDELDRSMTHQGTIGVKSPDVWGQDRLAKFRSEYELQMAQWLKVGFKGVINASINRNEAKAQRLQLAAGLADVPPAGSTAATAAASQTDETKALLALIASQNATTSATAAAATVPAAAVKAAGVDPSAAGMLEPTVVLDEHSHYLNHLNQLRRINAGDDLTDRPGYGLYLVRIPVTLSPGPKNRRGRGAMITVSAKSLMDRETMRHTLRNAVINEAVGSVSQAICNEPGDDEPASGPGLGPMALVAAADSEVFYGPENIYLLRRESGRQLARELADEPYHRGARISEWLRGEFEASYSLLEQAASPQTSASASGQAASAQGAAPAASEEDPLESLGALIARRDFAKLAAMRPRAADDAVMLASGAGFPVAADEPAANRRRTLDALGFVLRIQAAALNARLKQDLIEQLPELRREDLRRVNFFSPEPSDDALTLFQKYTDAKWPLRVYAIEPVIAQQNVADTVARRASSGLDLIGGVPLGPFRGAGVFSSDSALAEDEAAIRLNPTMVGFGAGENTFGWIFYPRLQTSRVGRYGLDAVSHMVQHGLGREDKEQSLEPGQRECTALIVMPNFVPKIEFITVANWFKTSDMADGRNATIEHASDLAARLVEAENALNRVGTIASNRPEELQIAVERLNQLKSLMPTQRLVVRVPFSAEQNDSRVFCSRGGQLKPALLAWHGKPPEPGEEATIFLEGKNFSVHDTHVIAGGKSAEAVLVSRNLLQVTIPKDARPTPNDVGEPLLAISLATPNGASNHLLIRMQPPNAPPATAPTPPPPPAPQVAAAVGPPEIRSLKPPDADPDLHRASNPAPAEAPR